MRVFLLVLATLIGAATLAQAGSDAEVPAQYKEFFADFSALSKKYPEAAKRFGLFDREPKSSPALRSAFCTGPGQCCLKYVDEGGPFLRCVECGTCLP
ncbi:hypothetical protein [Hyphomicrobium sp. LHD-15]|uniref:hypothetical protein n=1 Tax=Hyphomicrobium sp. LHD-15 TaxID=3072142 RepID=UPI00280C850B|nr:hypothetical protein [Hyphomicrobium sp. LHD-15]MDQ8700737.1 hypothetical protein [Hyphomicrobium sp. LHD-15]